MNINPSFEKTIEKRNTENRLDETAVIEYLIGRNILGDRTIIKGIKKHLGWQILIMITLNGIILKFNDNKKNSFVSSVQKPSSFWVYVVDTSEVL